MLSFTVEADAKKKKNRSRLEAIFGLYQPDIVLKVQDCFTHEEMTEYGFLVEVKRVWKLRRC